MILALGVLPGSRPIPLHRSQQIPGSHRAATLSQNHAGQRRAANALVPLGKERGFATCAGSACRLGPARSHTRPVRQDRCQRWRGARRVGCGPREPDRVPGTSCADAFRRRPGSCINLTAEELKCPLASKTRPACRSWAHTVRAWGACGGIPSGSGYPALHILHGQLLATRVRGLKQVEIGRVASTCARVDSVGQNTQ